MNRFVRIVLNGSNKVIVGLVLIALPWLGSIYFCSWTPDNELGANSSPSSNPARAKASQPHLLPAGDSARCLLANDTQAQPNLAAACPARQTTDSLARQTDPNDPADGAILADSAEAEKSELASIPPSGLIAKEDFGRSPADSSPPMWTPKEAPIAEENAESSIGPAISSDVGSAVKLPNQQTDKLPNQQTDLAAEANSNAESSPASKMSKAVANSASSAQSAPAQITAVNIQSDALSTDREQAQPSTEPLSTDKATTKDLPVRSEQMESIARQADRQTRHGFELAGRGAYFAARSEFIAALRLVAQGLDADGRTKTHGKSLAAALTALKEAEDFLTGGARLEADLDLPAIIAGHSTPVLKDADIASVTALTALKSYFTFAQEKLAQAEGSEVAGSMALHALGKLHEELAKGKGPGTKAAGPKAILFYQAALLVCTQNFMAANDLGVMLARNGNYEDARKMLEYSLSLRKQSDVWHNLAVVYEHLGRNDQARQAQQQSIIALQMEQARRQNMLVGGGDQVCWVDENTFAQTYNPSGIQQGVPSGTAVSGNPLLQQAESAAAPTWGILQPASNQYRPRNVNANAAEAPSVLGPPLPVLQPAAEWISKTPYDTRR
ncbi:MAG: tetratricopeptide repeat protein [Thermoguttaceae bacterium]